MYNFNLEDRERQVKGNPFIFLLVVPLSSKMDDVQVMSLMKTSIESKQVALSLQ